MDEADQKLRDEEKAVFANLIKMQQEAEERQFRSIGEEQRANGQLLLHMMGTLVKALLPQSDTPAAESLPTTLTGSPFAHHDPPATMVEPHPAASPREISHRPAAATENALPESSSSLLTDINTQVFDRSQLFVTCRQRGWLSESRFSILTVLKSDFRSQLLSSILIVYFFHN